MACSTNTCERLSEVTREGVTGHLVSSTLYRAGSNPRVLVLVERLGDREVLLRHMASDHSRRFQVAQQSLLERPATATFYTSACV